MSENITHTAVVDDSLRLMQAAGTVCEAFNQAARDHLDMAHLGCMTRGGDRCNPGLLTTFRDRWADRTPDDLLEPKLAFVLGWLCHRAADREMKPIFRTARRLQHGETLAPDAVDDAIDAGTGSHYGHALALATGSLRAASEFFTGRIEMEALKERLHIGKPGCDGKPV